MDGLSFPLYLKTYYLDEPLFTESKIVSSIYKPDFKSSFKKICEKEFLIILTTFINNLKRYLQIFMLSASNYSDGTILASDNIPDEVKNELKKATNLIGIFRNRRSRINN